MSKGTDKNCPGPAAALPCACASLRRAARAVTRLYDQELRDTGLELTQFTLLMALHVVGEITQGELGKLLALDSTTLTRTLRPFLKRGLIRATPGLDRRKRHLRLTAQGKQKFNRALPAWEEAQRRLQHNLSPEKWRQLGDLLAEVTASAR
jgi:DNA-binding MarR family transcriptional regulator